MSSCRLDSSKLMLNADKMEVLIVPSPALNNWTLVPSKFWTLTFRVRNLSNILVLRWIRLYLCPITSVMYTWQN